MNSPLPFAHLDTHPDKLLLTPAAYQAAFGFVVGQTYRVISLTRSGGVLVPPFPARFNSYSPENDSWLFFDLEKNLLIYLSRSAYVYAAPLYRHMRGYWLTYYGRPKGGKVPAYLTP